MIWTKLGPFKYTVHNVIAHPLSELAFLIGLKKFSIWIHDVTLPTDHSD
jgi:hypothetical protein